MASTHDFYGGSVQNREARPPPPKPTGTTAARRTAPTNAASRPKPAYKSTRSVAATKPSGSNPASKAMPNRNSASSSTRTSTVNNRSSLPRARKAPVASHPVGSYYNSSTSNESTNTGVGVANPYATPVVAAASASTAETTDTTDNDTWDDWGSPAPKATTTTTANPHSSWAAPVPSTTSSAATNDWYGASTNTPIAPSGYSSAGFTNQPSQQQQQQQQTQLQPGVGFHQNNNAQQQHQPFLSGAMDSSAPTMSAVNPGGNMGMTNTGNNAAQSGMPSFSMFMPSSAMQEQSQGTADKYPAIEDEAPILDELGINIENMLLKSKAVVLPFSRFGGDHVDPASICQEADLLGPIALLLLLGFEMVLTGKIQFGYIYVYGLFGCIAMTLVVNLMSPSGAVSIWTVGSIMGYALLPVNLLALIKIFVMNIIHMQTLGNILGGLTVVWSTMASTRLLELGCDLRDQRYLIAYPLLLFYSAFVMMTIL